MIKNKPKPIKFIVTFAVLLIFFTQSSFAFDLSLFQTIINPVGNRNPSTWQYNSANRLTNNGTYTYQYDDNGNLISKSGPSGTTTYAYDYENRLITINHSLITIHYAYDGLGRCR